jgi:hypothetical protein
MLDRLVPGDNYGDASKNTDDRLRAFAAEGVFDGFANAAHFFVAQLGKPPSDTRLRHGYDVV